VIPDPKAAGYTYDSSVYSVSVALTDDGAGKITATPTYYKGTSTVESASFGNSYASSGKVILQAAKTLSGKTLAAEQFSFELKDSTGKVPPDEEEHSRRSSKLRRDQLYAGRRSEQPDHLYD
jgi:pilin isopeptide linkage protein